MKGYLLAVSFASSLALLLVAGCGGSSSGGSAGSDGSGGSSGGGGGGGGCFEVTGSGSTQACAYTSNTIAGFSCTGGTKSGSCPGASLFGCCVTTTMTSGYTIIDAACYYDSTTGGAAKMECTGAGAKWQTSAP